MNYLATPKVKLAEAIVLLRRSSRALMASEMAEPLRIRYLNNVHETTRGA